MDKTSYKIPTEKEMKQSKGRGRKGIQKHFVLRHDLDTLVCEYSKKLGISQAQVIEEMMLIGVSKFEENHGFRVGKQSEKRTEDLTEQLNKRTELIMEQKRKEASKKANDLAEAYSKKIVHDYNNDDWQTQGYA